MMIAQRYHDHAEATIARLCEPEFVAHEDTWEGVLKHGSYHEAKQLGVDESVMWGEYFFVETLARVVQARWTTIRRPPLGDRLTTGRVIAVLRASRVSALAPVCDVLVEEGILSLELTLTTPGLLDHSG